MCARFSLTSPIEAMRHLFDFSERPNFAPSYNIAPTTRIPVIRQNLKNSEKEHDLFLAHWGLIPSWANDKSISAKLINARSETVQEKPSFKHAFTHQRCLIPCNGYYEWEKRSDGSKRPHLFYTEDKTLFAMAGLWEKWEDSAGQIIDSCTILTTNAADNLKDIHHRMPIIVNPDYFSRWLKGSSRSTIPPFQHRLPVTYHSVSKRVGNVKNNDADLIKKLEYLETPRQGSLF